MKDTIKKSSNALIVGAIIVLVLFIILIISGYIWSLKWVGVSGFINETEKLNQGKTLWDWMELLVIPLFLGLGVYLLDKNQREKEIQVSENRQKEDVLKNFLEKMEQYILESKLIDSKPNDEIRTIARTTTLTALHQLNGSRKAIALGFLNQAHLMDSEEGDRFGAKRINILVKGADFSEVELVNESFITGNFNNFKFHNAKIIDVDFSRSIFIGCDFRSTHFENVLFQYCDLSGAKFQDVTFIRKPNEFYREEEFAGSKLINVIIHKVNFRNYSFVNANMSYSDFSNTNFKEAAFSQAILENTNFTGCIFDKAKFGSAKPGGMYAGAIMIGANLNGANMTNARLYKADFSANYLMHQMSEFQGIVQGATLIKTKLIKANLRETNLCGANFTQADFENADLRLANFQELRVSEDYIYYFDKYKESISDWKLHTFANLSGANLRGANLNGANVSFEQLETADSLKNAILPNGRRCTSDKL